MGQLSENYNRFQPDPNKLLSEISKFDMNNLTKTLNHLRKIRKQLKESLKELEHTNFNLIDNNLNPQQQKTLDAGQTLLTHMNDLMKKYKHAIKMKMRG